MPRQKKKKKCELTWEPNHSSVRRKCEVKSLRSKPEAGWVEREWKIHVFPRRSLYFTLQMTEATEGFPLQKRLHQICILKGIFSTSVDKGMKTGKTENSKIRYINRGILVIQSLSHVRLCDTMDCSTSAFPVRHQLPELAQTHVHWVGDAIQPSRPLSSPSPPHFNLSQHQGLF